MTDRTAPDAPSDPHPADEQHRLGARSTATEVVAGLDLRGSRVVVTGATSGIGVETARALAVAGAEVTLAVRRPDAGRAVAADITATSGNPRVLVAELDLASLSSVEAFVGRWDGPLHVLVNNAGVMDVPEGRTEDGFETHLGSNHLGHHALATGLHDALAAAGGARVVSLSSSGHAASPIRFDDPQFERDPYDAGLAYGQSKTATALFAVESTRRWRDDGIVSHAVMPGGIWTNLQQHWDPEVLERMKVEAADVVKTPEQGAATSVWAATAPELAGTGGRYLEDCGFAEVVDELPDGLHGVLPHAVDPEAARRLWDMSTDMIEAARARH